MDEDDTQNEDEVRRVISLYQANKLDKSNAWNCELIDKLETLVRNHNAYLRNFRVIAISLDATMKVYSIRVDTVCGEVIRLCGYGMSKSDGLSKNAGSRLISANEEGNQPVENVPARQSRKRRFKANIVGNLDQISHPIKCMEIPDDILFKLSSMNECLMNNLFITSLPTKMACIKINGDEKFFENYAYVPVEFHDDFLYDTFFDTCEQFTVMPHNFQVDLPIRPINSGLSGYQIGNSPIDESSHDSSIAENNEMDIEPGYIFNVNYNYALDSQIVSERNTGNPFFSDESICQDNNNNSIIPLNTPINEIVNNDIVIPMASVSKGEYCYRNVLRLPYPTEGPTYWKPNYRQSSHKSAAAGKINPTLRKKKIIEKPLFTIDDNNNDYNNRSDTEGFIKTTSKKAKAIRNCKYRQWHSEKLCLPHCLKIPKDFFYTYTYEPSHNVFEPPNQSQSQETDGMPEQNDENNFNDNDDFQMDLSINPETSNGNGFNLEREDHVNISQHFENAPQVVEIIPIAYEKRAKVINMGRLNSATMVSIDNQLVRSAQNGIVCTLDRDEEFEPGKAVFSNIYRDLLVKKRTFMQLESELTTGLVLFSTLNAVNKERLQISRKPNDENDFEIVQMKELV